MSERFPHRHRLTSKGHRRRHRLRRHSRHLAVHLNWIIRHQVLFPAHTISQQQCVSLRESIVSAKSIRCYDSLAEVLREKSDTKEEIASLVK